MIYPTQHHFFGVRAHRDARTGRWASRADYLAQVDRVAAQVLEARAFAGALMLALCRPVLCSRAPSRAARHAVHRALGDAHPQPFPSLTTPGQRAWTRRNPVAWGHVEA